MSELIFTVGAAIDWLIAHPGEMLVDKDGDLWRLVSDERPLEVQVGDGDWSAASLAHVAAPWRPLRGGASA